MEAPITPDPTLKPNHPEEIPNIIHGNSEHIETEQVKGSDLLAKKEKNENLELWSPIKQKIFDSYLSSWAKDTDSSWKRIKGIDVEKFYRQFTPEEIVDNLPNYMSMVEEPSYATRTNTHSIEVDDRVSKIRLKISSELFSQYLYRGILGSDAADRAGRHGNIIEAIDNFVRDGGMHPLSGKKDLNKVSTTKNPLVAFSSDNWGPLSSPRGAVFGIDSSIEGNGIINTVIPEIEELSFNKTVPNDKIKFILMHKADAKLVLDKYGENTIIFGNKPLKDIIITHEITDASEFRKKGLLQIINLVTGDETDASGRIKSKIINTIDPELLKQQLRSNILEKTGELPKVLKEHIDLLVNDLSRHIPSTEIDVFFTGKNGRLSSSFSEDLKYVRDGIPEKMAGSEKLVRFVDDMEALKQKAIEELQTTGRLSEETVFKVSRASEELKFVKNSFLNNN